MNDQRVLELIELLLAETITAEQHVELQEYLKANPESRGLLRARVDLESGLRTWAAEPSSGTVQVEKMDVAGNSRDVSDSARFRLFAIAATILLIAVPLAVWYSHSDTFDFPVADPGPDVNSSTLLLGAIQQQADCVWENQSALAADGFTTGTLVLTRGLAELRFHSGTNVVLEAPCEVKVLSAASAMLLAGSVFADVTELSDGFTLQTPELTISDEGTEFAVSLDDSSTEIHVFDGSVFCEPNEESTKTRERIGAGQARRFIRSRPGRANRIPFEARRFARRLKVEVQSAAGDSLLAYDGFENPAGRMRPERNGLGWMSGWKSIGRDQQMPAMVAAPELVVLDRPRPGRQLLRLENRDAIRRPFENAISIADGGSIYVSAYLKNAREPDAQEISDLIQISLIPSEAQRSVPRRRGGSPAFGVTDEGLPFIKTKNQIAPSAPAMIQGADYFVVFRLERRGESVQASVRFFHASEPFPSIEPNIWTIENRSVQKDFQARAIRVGVGRGAVWEIDELKVGTSWASVLPIESVE